MSFNKFPSTDNVSAGDAVAVWQPNVGDWRSAPLSVLAAYLQTALSFPNPVLVTQYATPTATGFNVLVAQASNTWLILTPSATFAAGTITLPAAPPDQQFVDVVTTQIITALTVAGNGKGVVGQPTTLAANGFFRMRYDAASGVWRRVG